jgi:hypothetical protein
MRYAVDELDDDDVLQDGDSLHVPFYLLDGRPVTFDPASHQPGFRMTDGRDAARAARDAWIEKTCNAWKTPTSDAAEPDASEASRTLLRGEEPDDPQARRDAAWHEAKKRLGEAWKMGRGRIDPSRATEIERQRRGWLGGR